MKLPHFTQHGTRRDGDSLDVLDDETELLKELFDKWDETSPSNFGDRRAIVKAKWSHGTVGKLLLEHSAVWLASAEDVARTIQSFGRSSLADELIRQRELARPFVDHMAKVSRGVQPISLAITPEFVDAVNGLRQTIGPALSWLSREGSAGAEERLRGSREELKTAKFVRKHAPAHPGRHHFYDNLPMVVRLHSAFDRLAGFPWGESSLGNSRLARAYDQEALAQDQAKHRQRSERRNPV